VGSTWCMVPVRRPFKADGLLSRSVAWSYPVTPLAAFALSGAFDKWDAIRALNLGQPAQPCRTFRSMPAWTPSGRQVDGRGLVSDGSPRLRRLVTPDPQARVGAAARW
jgi:hypothetical protein